MHRSKRIQIILAILNVLFYVAIGGYSMITIFGGIYFRKMISSYGLISTFKLGRLWLTYGSIILLVFSIFYLVQIIIVSIKYRELKLRNADLEEEIRLLKGEESSEKPDKKS